MGSDPIYLVASALNKMRQRPYVLGGFAIVQGFFGAMLRQDAQHNDPELRAFIRAYQRRALFVGKAQAASEIEMERASLWSVEKDS
jgi:hypothetical protein